MIDRRNSWKWTLGCLVAALALLGCAKQEQKSSEKNEPVQNSEVSLSGAGATFPFPLYSKWISEYNKLHPNVRINYQSIGSGGGIRQITSGTVDFGATDAPMSEADAKKATGTIHHLPMTVGAVVVAYNLPAAGDAKEPSKVELKLDGPLLADIFAGKVTKWNDPRIVALNEGNQLPDLAITVITRTDGSGTTAVFTDYLATVSPEFKEKIGVGKAVKWPVGLGAKGNEGVTGQLKTTPGSLGYIELAYATQNKLPTALLRNKSGQFVKASAASGTAAAEGRAMPPSLYVSLADVEGAQAYPISSYTYLLVFQDAKEEEKGQALAEFLWWAIHEGQKFSAELDYAPLPASVVEQLEQRLRGLSFQGKKLLANR
ncbi:MAG TPA: phosphate ABC transporter substrate-binding protein PstS [Polyangiaceae bacterium]|nr:phosphate ABC transporter substrate-binding protein PstS [Polyangiaceae bacterium]